MNLGIGMVYWGESKPERERGENEVNFGVSKGY